MPAFEVPQNIFPHERDTRIELPKEFFEAEVNAHPDTATYYIFPDGTHTTYVGQQFMESIGFSDTEWRANPNFGKDHIYDLDKKRVNKECEEKLLAGLSYDGKYRFVGKNDIYILRDHSEIVKADDGSLLFYKCTLTDITEQSQWQGMYEDAADRLEYANGALELARDFMKALDNNPYGDIVFITDREGKCLNISTQSPQHSLGIPAAAFEGQNLLHMDIIHPEDAEKIRNEFLRARTEAEQSTVQKDTPIAPMEVRLKNAVGEYIYFECTGIYHTPELRAGEFVINARNIHKRKRAEAEALAQAKYSRALAEAIASINSPLNEKEILDAIAQQIGNIVDYTSASIHFVEEKDGVPHISMSDRWNGTEHQRVIQEVPKNQPASDYPPIEQIIKTGVPVVIPDTTNSSRWNNRGSETKSYIGIPLIIEGKVVAVLNLNNVTAGKYTDADRERLAPFASAISVAIGKAKKFELTYEQATTDVLTGTANRAYFKEFSGREIAQAIRYESPLSFMMIDIRKFKLINDTYGHPAGDKALIAFAQALTGNTRNTDMVGRYGGDEFAIALPQTDIHQGYAAAENINAVLETLEIETDKGQMIHPRGNIGLTAILTGDNFDTLVQRADDASYVMKNFKEQGVGIFIPRPDSKSEVAVIQKIEEKGVEKNMERTYTVKIYIPDEEGMFKGEIRNQYRVWRKEVNDESGVYNSTYVYETDEAGSFEPTETLDIWEERDKLKEDFYWASFLDSNNKIPNQI